MLRGEKYKLYPKLRISYEAKQILIARDKEVTILLQFKVHLTPNTISAKMQI